ncbi:hypothetical protein B0H19DRAFT_1189032 [Mycena capillaripes]|nr:hypothetical protein B0H19DRAFT_1189032 [Mycena capillaripes]
MAHYTTRRLSRTQNFSFSEGIFSPSAEAINYVLANITPEEFHSGIKTALTSAPLSLSQRQIDDFLAILKTAGIPKAALAQRAVADETLRHCVRCHFDYYEKNNGRVACSVPHAIHQPQLVEGESDQSVIYVRTCCSNTDGDPYHCLDRHTTVRKSVASYNSSNIQPWCLRCPDEDHRAPSPDSHVMTSPAASRGSTPVATTSEFEAEIQGAFAHLAHADISSGYQPQRQSSASTESSYSDSVSSQEIPYMGY